MPFFINSKPESRREAANFALMTAFVVVGVAGCSKAQPTSVLGDASHPAPVHFYTVAEETARRRIQAVGSLYALEESTLSSEVEGRVDEVLSDVGDNVREGQPLVRLDPRELQFEVDRQRGIVTQVRAQLGIGPNDPPPSDPKKIASVQRAEADLFDADQKYKRRAAAGARPGTVRRRRARRYSRVPMKTSRVLVAIALLTPALVSAQSIARRQDAAPWRPSSGWVKGGVTVDLHVDAFPQETFHGKISRINPAIAQDSRTFEAEALLANLDGRLKPGFFVQASIPSEKEEKTIFLPEGAVNYRYGVYKVFLLNGDHVAERQIRPAGQTEDERGRRFEVAEGLKPGDRVAVAVSGELHDGAVVQQAGGNAGNTPAMK